MARDGETLATHAASVRAEAAQAVREEDQAGPAAGWGTQHVGALEAFGAALKALGRRMAHRTQRARARAKAQAEHSRSATEAAVDAGVRTETAAVDPAPADHRTDHDGSRKYKYVRQQLAMVRWPFGALSASRLRTIRAVERGSPLQSTS